MKSPELTSDLLARHGPGNERGGIILSDGTVVELQNLMSEPTEGCVFDPAELLPYEDRMAATWHTHPTSTAALSGMDWDSFLGWPDLLHAIIGTDGVRWYAVKGMAVLNA